MKPTTAELNQTIAAMRSIAEPVGPLHSYWDYILDLEAIRDGRPASSVYETDAELLNTANQILAGAHGY